MSDKGAPIITLHLPLPLGMFAEVIDIVAKHYPGIGAAPWNDVTEGDGESITVYAPPD